jgi:acyl dehydratase
MTGTALTFDQLEVGREWVSAPRTLTADDLRSYSTLTGDDDPAGGDPGDAQDRVGGAEEAGALFGPAVATGLALDCPPVRTIAFLTIRDWRFVGPIAAGDAVHIRNRVDAVRPRGVGRRAEVEWHVEVVNQREEVVQGGSIISLVEGPAVGRGRRPAPESGPV